MEEKEAREILESQFKILSDQSKECEPECLKDITDSMLNIYTTLYRCQSFAM